MSPTSLDYLDSGIKPGNEGKEYPVRMSEATEACEEFSDYEKLICQFLIRRVKRLEKELKALRKELRLLKAP